MSKAATTLRPEQALNDLFGSVALLRAAGADDATVAALHRGRCRERELGDRRWSDADVPLLDELEAMLGRVSGAIETGRDVERDDADEFEQAARRDLDAVQGDLAWGTTDDLDDEVAALSFEQLAELDAELTEELLAGLEADPYPDADPDPGPWLGWDAHDSA